MTIDRGQRAASSIGHDARFQDLLRLAPDPVEMIGGVFARNLPSTPLIDLVVSPNLMSEPLRQSVGSAGYVSLRVLTTRRAEVLFRSTVDAPPLVAIVVPTYNCAHYIRETLDSIRTQDYATILVAIVDDESTDETVERIQQFMTECTDEVAVVFTGIPHIGNPGLTRNIGIGSLTPPHMAYLAFMDGDDLYASPDAIKSLVDCLERQGDKIAAFGDYDWIRSDGAPLAPPSGLRKRPDGAWRWSENRRLTWKTLANGSVTVFHLQCLMVRRGAPYLPYRPRGEDVEYYAHLFGMSCDDGTDEIGAVTQIPKLIAHYRRHAASYSHGTHVFQEPGTLRRSLDGVPVPWIYEWARVPDRYITEQNLGEFFLRRHLRECIRAIFQREWSGAWTSIRRAVNDKLISKTALLTLPAKELASDPATRATIGYAATAIGLRHKYHRKPKPSKR